jgi:hypothetical protein
MVRGGSRSRVWENGRQLRLYAVVPIVPDLTDRPGRRDPFVGMGHSGKRPSKRIANWLRILAQWGIGMLHFLAIF